nr:SpoIIE family protein phosphatase [Pelodictyon luteolum]
MMRFSKSIVIRMIVVITLCSAGIFAVTLVVNYLQSRSMLEMELEENARNLASSLANRVDAELVSVAKVTEGMARSLDTAEYSREGLVSLIGSMLDANPSVYGSAIAFEPYAFNKQERLYAPYLFRDEGAVKAIRLDASYRYVPYLYQDWYQIPVELQAPVWSEPYFDDGGGNATMATCSVPFYYSSGGKREVKGVVSADIRLDSLTQLISSVRILKTGYAMLLSRNGMVLTHPDSSFIMNESIFSIAEERRDPVLREMGRKMIAGESGFVHHSLTDEPGWMYYAPIRSTGWTLAVVFPEAELFENVRSLSLTMAGIGTGGLLLLALVVAMATRSITLPLRALASATGPMASGNFDVELPAVRSNDEIGMLTSSFRMMGKSLKEYIRNLTETTAQKERIQSELQMATDIQASLLPRIFPAFPERPEFDIFASMDAAKEVGGDFYDFFFIDDSHLCFLIADVADKGVPAALYMMVAKTLLKSEAQRLRDPGVILEHVNNILAEDNESCMFATVFCAILDTASGELIFSNAGHNPPLLVGSGGVRYLDVKPGFLLGPVPDSGYETERITLRNGDVFFLYTDGVTEAKNREDELFGEQRLLEILQGDFSMAVEDMVHAVRSSVAGFAEGAAQSDDITMVALQYTGNGISSSAIDAPLIISKS